MFLKKRLLFFMCLSSAALTTSIPSQAKPAPAVSGLLSIIPGLGQVANGDTLEGLGWFVTTVGLYAGSSYTQQIGWDLWQYNLYDAYRDAGPRDTTKYNVFQNYIAVFNPLNLIDPIGFTIVAYGAYGGAGRGYPALRSPAKILTYSFVGLGEEGLFRGFLFPGLSHTFNSKPVGAITSSALFTLFHVTGGTENLAFSPMIQRFLAGIFLCWQADRNKYDLRHNIFAHAWYDVLVDKTSTSGMGTVNGMSINFPM